MPRRLSDTRISLHITFLAIAAAAVAAIASNGFAAAGNPPLRAEADTPEHTVPSADMIGRLLAQPNKENFTALQNRVVADRSYDQSAHGLSEMIDLYNRKRYQEALDKFTASMPDQLLSPQAHFFAARCYEELGKKDMQKSELAFVRACLTGLLATGDGSPARPILVTHVSDEYDLLAAPLKTESKSQSLVEKQGRWYDVIECANGKTYWFDVTLTFGHKRGGTPAAAPAKPATTVQTLKQSSAQPAPVQPIPSRATLAQAAYHRGVAAVNLHDYARAVVELDESIRLDATSPDAFFERGFAFVESYNYGAAYVDFSDAIRLRSDYALAFYERGLVLRLGGDKSQFDNAIADFSEAIRLAPGDYLAWRNRAMLWFAKGDYHKAIDDNSEAILLRPDDAMSYNNRGFAYESAGDFSRAVADFNQAIRLSPRIAQSYAGRGVAWVGRGEYDLAIVDLDEAIRLKPDYAAAYAYRSTAFAQKGDATRARADAAKAASLRGTVASAGQ